MEKKYSKKHLWIAAEGDVVTIGITDFLQEKLGDIMFVNLPDVGEKVTVDERFGDVESKKAVVDLDSIVSGEVIEVNDDVIDEPYLINDAPYESWLIKVKYLDVANNLMDEDAYQNHISQPWMQSNK